MNGPDLLSALHARREEISAALEQGEQGVPETDRERIRQEIVTLFREAEELIERLEDFKEGIRPLVDRYKALSAAMPKRTPPVPAALPRADHLGSTTFLERGWSAIATGEFAQAEKELTRALELTPDDSQAEALLGWAQMLMGEYDDALALFQKVLLRDPEHELARVNLGYVCLKRGIFGESIEHLSRVLRVGTDRKARLYANLYMGLVYLEREMHTDARSFFAQALELGPNLIEAYWELGRSYYLEGDRDGARDAWCRGAKANRFSPWGERCEGAVAHLDAGEEVSLA
jgi:tetratricopeptide (TPR) repeat protein